jgi:hypothetical protein
MPDPLGLQPLSPLTAAATGIEYFLRQSALHRILAFTGRSIDDVVNDPIARNQVWAYYKLSRQIDRAGEITELERQWNATPL